MSTEPRTYMQKIFEMFSDWFVSQDFVIQIMVAPAFIAATLLIALAPWAIATEAIRFIFFMLFNYGH